MDRVGNNDDLTNGRQICCLIDATFDNEEFCFSRCNV